MTETMTTTETVAHHALVIYQGNNADITAYLAAQNAYETALIAAFKTCTSYNVPDSIRQTMPCAAAFGVVVSRAQVQGLKPDDVLKGNGYEIHLLTSTPLAHP